MELLVFLFYFNRIKLLNIRQIINQFRNHPCEE